MSHLQLEHLNPLPQCYCQMLCVHCLLILVFIQISWASYLSQESLKQRMASLTREIQK